jgi:hypothetical protein
MTPVSINLGMAESVPIASALFRLLLVHCFACGVSQTLDLVLYHQFPAL